jgi:rare lipoprotein A
MVASWYGAPYHGRLTASGERYDQEAMTAAHNFLPFGALLECEVAGKTAIVRVTDRGPFIAGRDLDLSRAAARQLGMIDAGVAVLNVRRVE